VLGTEFLNKVPLFANLSGRDYRNLADAGDEISYPSMSEPTSLSDFPVGFFVVAEGRASVAGRRRGSIVHGTPQMVRRAGTPRRRAAHRGRHCRDRNLLSRTRSVGISGTSDCGGVDHLRKQSGGCQRASWRGPWRITCWGRVPLCNLSRCRRYVWMPSRWTVLILDH
jgi:hypothetical protein